MDIRAKKKATKTLHKTIKEKWLPLSKGQLTYEPVCDCCLQYNKRVCYDGRYKCPIYQYTGHKRCEMTPYQEWIRLNNCGVDLSSKWPMKNAKKELSFLRKVKCAVENDEI